MQLGLHVASFTWPDQPQSIRPTLADLARTADEGGFTWLTVMDHWFQMDQYFDAAEPMLEGYTTLGYVAGLTQRVQLGLLVTGVTYRWPGLLAKTVTTLDVLSNGRAFLGIGAAWYEREHDGLGVPFPGVSERFEQLEETLEICLQMWSGDVGAYDGEHFELAETLNSPPAIRDPHPPIMVGGNGEQKTLRLVAKYGDACNLLPRSPEEVTHKLGVLRRHCDDLGTDYDAIQKTTLYTGTALFGGDVETFVKEMTDYAAVGVEGVFVMPIGPDPRAITEKLVAEAVPKLADL